MQNSTSWRPSIHGWCCCGVKWSVSGERNRKARYCSPVVILLKGDHPGAALSDLAVTHDEQLGHRHAHFSARGALRRAGELCHDDVALLDHANDVELWRVYELGRAVNGLVVGMFAAQLEGAEDGPLDVVGQARQDLLMIIIAEAVQVGVNSLDVLRHGAS